MSKILKATIKNCDNHYTAEEIISIFGLKDKEIQICMNCKNCVIEDGIITCKHIINNLEGAEIEDEN